MLFNKLNRSTESTQSMIRESDITTALQVRKKDFVLVQEAQVKKRKSRY